MPVFSSFYTTKIEKLLVKYKEEVLFKRNHPFLEEWDDWKETVGNYHSIDNSLLSYGINKGDRRFQPLGYLQSIIDYVYWCHPKIQTVIKEFGFEEAANWIDFDSMVTWPCDCMEKYYRAKQLTETHHCFRGTLIRLSEKDQFYEDQCPYVKEHYLAWLLSLLWANYHSSKLTRKDRRYYRNLEKVIISLSYDRLRDFDLNLIKEPPRFYGRGRNLLKQLYERCYLDKINIEELPFAFENVKHARQQGGTCQSGSAFYPDSIVSHAEAYFKKFDNFPNPKQQMFNLNHNVKFTDENFKRIKEIVVDSQEKFVNSLQNAMINSGKKIMVMFMLASTAAIVAKMALFSSVYVLIKLLNMIYKFLTLQHGFDLPKQQSGSAELSIPFLPALILKYVINPPSSVLMKLWKSNQTDLVMRRIGYLGDPKIHKGVESAIDWVSNMVMQTINWYRKSVLGLDPLENIDRTSCAIEEWQEQVDDIVRKYYAGELVFTESSWSVIMNLYSRGLSFTRQPIYNKFKNDVWKIVVKLGNILEKFSTHIRNGNKVRNPPVTIYISGDSGVGKSSLTYPLAAEILNSIFQKEGSDIDLSKHWESMIYMRSPEQEFWDGYDNQLVTVFDDFNQLVDSSANPNLELFEIIRASNCFPYPLHMASLDQKANTTFNSKIIIVSSNLEIPKTASLNFPNALERRFDICVKVGRKPNYPLVEGKFDPNVYEMQMYDMTTRKFGEFMSFKDLIYAAVTKYFKNKGFVNSVDEYVKNIFRPQQQGVGNIIGLLAKRTAETVASAGISMVALKHDIQAAWYGDEYLVLISELKGACDRLKKRKNEIQLWWSEWRQQHPYMFKCLIFIGTISIALALVKMFIGMTAPAAKKMLTFSQFCRPEGYNPARISVPKFEAYVPPSIKPVKFEGIKPKAEGVRDVNACEILAKIVRSNMYKMYEVDSNIAIGHVFFLRGKICIMPRHYLDAFKQFVSFNENSSIRFEGVFLERAFDIRIVDLFDNLKVVDSPPEDIRDPQESKDLMAANIPTAIFHGDATSYFLSIKTLQYVERTHALLPVLVENDYKKSRRPIIMLHYTEGKSVLRRIEKLPVTDENDVVVRYIRDAWGYSMDTKVTECGAPLIARNPQLAPGKICGIHIAGIDGAGLGYSTPIYKEDVELILSHFDNKDKVAVKETEFKDYPTQQCQVPDDSVFVRLGSLDKSIAQPAKSKIGPSLVHGEICEPKTRPCLLREGKVNGELFNPRTYRIGRLGNVPTVLPENLVSSVRDAFISELKECLYDVNLDNTMKAVYTPEEAILGIDGADYVQSIKRTTSPGYPYVQMNGFETRKKIFGDAELIDLSSKPAQIVLSRVKMIIDKAKRNEAIPHYFMDTLKDERKPIHKSHKTRLFSAGPLDYLIACKMYFNGVIALLQKSRNINHISVGSNPYSEDWGQIVKVLDRKSSCMIAGDFEGFDASQHQRLLEASVEVLIAVSKQFLGSTEEDVQVMRVLAVGLFNSYHITGREVYRWTHSLPSGHYLTATLNSVFVNLAFSAAWCIANDKVGYKMARSFWKQCGIVANGDDHIVSVPRSKISKFNQSLLPTIFSTIGLGYTMEDKDAVATEQFRDISQISYLKRSFTYWKEADRWLAPLQLDVILETPMWLHRCPDERIQTIANLEWAIRELSLHDDEKWNKWFPIFDSLLSRMGHETEFRHKLDVRREVLESKLEM